MRIWQLIISLIKLGIFFNVKIVQGLDADIPGLVAMFCLKYFISKLNEADETKLTQRKDGLFACWFIIIRLKLCTVANDYDRSDS